MVHPGGQGGVDRGQQIVIGLPRRAVDEVDADVGEAGVMGFPGRRHGPARCVGSVQGCQYQRRRGLHAQRYPGVARGADIGEELARGGFRVGLGGDLGTGGQSEIVPDTVEHLGQTRCTQ